jgi:hypothetical protein
MIRKWRASLVSISVALLLASDQTWKDKQVAEWSEAGKLEL